MIGDILCLYKRLNKAGLLVYFPVSFMLSCIMTATIWHNYDDVVTPQL